MFRRFCCLVVASGCLQPLSNNSQTVRGRQASVVLSSVHQTDEFATVSATKHLRTVASLLLWSNKKAERYFRNDSSWVYDAKISWNSSYLNYQISLRLDKTWLQIGDESITNIYLVWLDVWHTDVSVPVIIKKPKSCIKYLVRFKAALTDFSATWGQHQQAKNTAANTEYLLAFIPN